MMRRFVLSYVARRMMFLQGKIGPPLVLCLVTLSIVLFLLVRLQSDVERLDAERMRLENAVELLRSNSVRLPSVNSDDLIVVYNRVPKTGSTSFVGIAYDLYSNNNFHVLHVNVSRNNHVLSVADQMRFATNITSWSAVKPAFYHGHLAFIDFARFGVSPPPVYINIVRDPIDRLVSYYYFLRNGDDFRPHLKRRRAGDRETFDECVAKESRDCGERDLWMQIPFFCGHVAECWSVGSEWALQMAKHNLVNRYLVVGVTDEMQDFVAVLEAVLPRFFAGALDFYTNANRSHLRRTYNKIAPSLETIQRLRQSSVWKMENEFYEFARNHFHFVKERTLTFHDGRPVGVRSQKFVYEKIRPR